MKVADAGGAPPRGAGIGALIEAAELRDVAAPLFQPGDGVLSLTQRMVEHEHFAEAVRLLAHALPRREGIWWAWFCARRASGEAPAPPIQGALDATERWIRAPGDEHRRQAMAAAEAADLGSPAGCVAFAAFLSGGSIAPPDAPDVPAPEYAAARAIAGSIIMSAVSQEPEKAPDRFRDFIAQGIAVVDKLGLK